jgi:hypothetical protein
MSMEDAARPGKLRWVALLALHTIIFVIGYQVAVRVLWGIAVILTRSGAQIDLAGNLNDHGLWTASLAGFVVGLIGVTGIEVAFGRVGVRRSLIKQPSLFVCVVFAAWFVAGVLRWTMTTMSQQHSVLAENSTRWFAMFIDTFFLADCQPGWLISQRNFDSCSNQLAYTTLFVASIGYATARLVGVGLFRSRHGGSTLLAMPDNSAGEE